MVDAELEMAVGSAAAAGVPGDGDLLADGNVLADAVPSTPELPLAGVDRAAGQAMTTNRLSCLTG